MEIFLFFFSYITAAAYWPSWPSTTLVWNLCSSYDLTIFSSYPIIILLYLIDLPIFPTTASHSPRFAPERQGKTQDSTEGKSREKYRFKAACVQGIFPVENTQKKMRMIVKFYGNI